MNEAFTEFSIIIPVYNEKKNILPSILSIQEKFKDNVKRCEILFVDDNSPDGTADEVLRLKDHFADLKIKLVQHGKKEGLGAAHLAGYQAAKGNYIMCLDADLSQCPSDLLIMQREIKKGKDLVIGSRYMPQSKQIGKSWVRSLGSKGMNLLVRIFLGVPLSDSTHTFRVFKRSVFEALQSKLNQKGHPSFQVQFSFWAIQKGYKVGEIPITFTERQEDCGKSKIKISKEVGPFLKLLHRLTKQRIKNFFFRKQLS